MDKSHSTLGPYESIVTLPADFAQHVAAEEHVALLKNPGKFDLLRRKDDLLAEGVASVFGLTGTEAELLALCFQVRKFTPAEAAKWLAKRGFVPLLFVPNSA
jgi:hypothetical protein